VKDPDGRSAGRLSDVVVHWTTRGADPSVKAIVMKAGKAEVVIGALARGRLAVGAPAAVSSGVQPARPSWVSAGSGG
jgi:hypothetical protein